METQKKQRPLFITMLCSFFLVYWGISIIGLIAALLINIGPQFPAFSRIASQFNLIFLGTQVDVGWITALVAIGLVAGVVGYWLFQKWAVIVYAASSVALFMFVLPPASSVPTKTLYAGLIFYVIASVFAVNIAMIVLGIINFKQMR
jgi:hypothetical protein